MHEVMMCLQTCNYMIHIMMVYFMVFIEWSKRRKMMESKYNRKNELPENCLKPNQVRGAVKDSHEDLMEHGSTFNSNLVK